MDITILRAHTLSIRDAFPRASIVDLIDAMLLDAYAHQASDVHVIVETTELSVWLRLDGMLTYAYSLPLILHQECIARLKIISGMRTDERAMPQDGRFTFSSGEVPFDVRIAVAPTQRGESVVLRLLSFDPDAYSLDRLGLLTDLRMVVEDTLRCMSGLILIAGPTGSGKTTTLYSFMREIQTSQRAIVTIEDPIEHSLPGIRQHQVNERVGFSFPHGLRSILRQDPDVIVVGEVRDEETARTALHAAETGHLVLATVHATDTKSAASRLIRLTKEAGSPRMLRLVLAQRLARKLCTECRVRLTPSEEASDALQSPALGASSLTYSGRYRASGCSSCGMRGYRGRTGIFEARTFGDRRETFSLRQDAAEKCAMGYLSTEEAIRTCHA